MLSGGFDLKVMRSGPEAAGRLVTDGGALFTPHVRIARSRSIVACSGHAVAAGALLLLGADERVGARGAFRIGLIETADRHGAAAVGGRAGAGAALAAALPAAPRSAPGCTTPTAPPTPASSTRWSTPTAARRRRAEPKRSGGPSCPAAPTAGQVRMNRGERLGRLADAIAADRGRSFDVPESRLRPPLTPTGRAA